MATKRPKEYISPAVAAARLISAGVDLIARGRRGVKVHWELKWSFKYDDTYKPWPGALAVSNSGTMTSGPEWDEDTAIAEAEEELKRAKEEPGEPTGDEPSDEVP